VINGPALRGGVRAVPLQENPIGTGRQAPTVDRCKSRVGYTGARLRRAVSASFDAPSSTGQQAVDIYLVLCAYIDMPIHNHRDIEP
jgi:hypothetical protein